MNKLKFGNPDHIKQVADARNKLERKDFPLFDIDIIVAFSGEESFTYQIRAEDEEEARDIATMYAKQEIIDYENGIDSTDYDILSVKETPPENKRDNETIDLFRQKGLIILGDVIDIND